MSISKFVRRYYKASRDFALGLSLFSLVALPGVVSNCSIFTTAHAKRYEGEQLPLVALPTPDVTAALPQAVVSGWSQMTVFVTLAIAFASIFAVNLWFARHVRRVHSRVGAKVRHGS